MLSTPPAFILSQDQTLMFKCLILAPVKTGLSGTSLWSAENEVLMCWSLICALYFLKVFVLWTILSFHLWNCFLNRIFRVALLFIYQGSVCLSHLRQLLYFIKTVSFCQALFYFIFIFCSVPLCKSSSLGDKSYHITMPPVCQQKIVSFFTSFHFSAKTA